MAMAKTTKRAPEAPPRQRWRIIIFRKRGQELGVVEASTAEAAIEEAAKRFRIRDADRGRLGARRLN